MKDSLPRTGIYESQWLDWGSVGSLRLHFREEGGKGPLGTNIHTAGSGEFRDAATGHFRVSARMEWRSLLRSSRSLSRPCLGLTPFRRTMATLPPTLEPATTAASSTNKTAHPFTRAALEDLLSRRFFYAPAFEIYGGTAPSNQFGQT